MPLPTASDNPFPSILLEDHVDPAAPSNGYHRLFVDTDEKLKMIDHASLVTDFTPSAGLLNKYDATVAPAVTDDSGDGYAVGSIWIDVTADKAYIAVDASVGAAVWNPFEAAGGAGGPMLAIDDVALHASGDEFDDDTLAGWTLGGGLTTGDVTAVTTETYDATALDIVFGAQSDYMIKSVPGTTDYECSLTILGQTNDAASPTACTNSMTGLIFVDGSGNGTGFSFYADGTAAYMWQVTAYAYAATGSAISSLASAGHLADSGMAVVLKLKKVGSTITGSLSYNGGTLWQTVTRSDSTTFTKMGICRLFSSGGTNPKLRVGRFNVTEL